MNTFAPVSMIVLVVIFLIVCGLMFLGYKTNGPTNESYEKGVPVQSNAIVGPIAPKDRAYDPINNPS